MAVARGSLNATEIYARCLNDSFHPPSPPRDNLGCPPAPELPTPRPRCVAMRVATAEAEVFGKREGRTCVVMHTYLLANVHLSARFIGQTPRSQSWPCGRAWPRLKPDFGQREPVWSCIHTSVGHCMPACRLLPGSMAEHFGPSLGHVATHG